LFQKLIEEHWQEASEQQKDALYGEQMRLAFDNTDIRLRDLLENTSVSGRKTFSFRWTSYAAACIVLLVGIFIYFNSSNDPLDPFGENYKHQSTLTLGHNEIIDIDTSLDTSRELYKSKGIALVQSAPEYIRIIATGNGGNSQTQRPVTLRVAKGRQLKLELVDGSVITVNSSSTLSFPMAFDSSSRNVGLEGEAYFEVASDKSRPFFVQTADQLVQVYGTKFNVKSYTDESKSTTTLLEGKVSVRKIEEGLMQAEYILEPGEQIIVDKNKHDIKQEPVLNETEVVAWTQGLFSYSHAPLKDILRDFSRWYNVKVDWEHIPDYYFQGTIPKDYSIQEALTLIKRTSNVNITLNNNYITFNQK
jgi:ferric-dicitrate binding protein FerR (iron transport regulator)